MYKRQTIESSGTISVQANVSSTAAGNGLILKSVGRISVTTTGATAGSPRLIGTAGGPITFWTTGTTGGVALGNFTQLNTMQSGTSGADITIGGGAASLSDANRPSGAAEHSGADGISLGAGPATSVVVMRAGTGAISLNGHSTGTGDFSGINLYPGNDLVGATVNLSLIHI